MTMWCPFCNEENMKKQLLKETSLFYIMFNIRPLTKNHLMVVPKRHIRSEDELTKKEWLEYQKACDIAYSYMKENGPEPTIFINATQDQSVPHFHKHYIEGRFGTNRIDSLFRKGLKGGL